MKSSFMKVGRVAIAWFRPAILFTVPLFSQGAGAVTLVHVHGRIPIDGRPLLYFEAHGAPTSRALLVWVHGGPGGPERPLFRYFHRELENTGLVIYYDQRGTARSSDSNADTRLLTIHRHLDDLHAVLRYASEHWPSRPLILVGHSWGAALSLLYAKRPGQLATAVVAVAPQVATQAQRAREYAFDLAEARRLADRGNETRLLQLGPPPYEDSVAVLKLGKITDALHGIEFKPLPHMRIAVAGIAQGLVRPWELPNYFRANDISLQVMHRELESLDLREQAGTLPIPVYFFLGRHDHHADPSIAEQYFEQLDAPRKGLIYFEQSAHEIPFEQPEQFRRQLEIILNELDAADVAPQ
ncbi:MAG: alpha/beta fold hydrolase [Steroidobacteraceae bacterium]